MAFERSLTLQEVADELGVHYMTAYRYVRLGILPAHKDGNIWRIQGDDVALFANGPTGTDKAGTGRVRRNADWSGRLLARLTAGDQRGAEGVVAAALTSGMDPTDIYLDVLAPALRRLGGQWADGTVTVAQEHQGFAVAARIVGQLSTRFSRSGRPKGVVVVGVIAGDYHSLPVTMLADVLRGEGYEVLDLGANVPTDAFAEVALGQSRTIAVGISASAQASQSKMVLAIKSLRAAVPHASVLVGGGAIPDFATATAVGADGWASDARGAIAEIERLSNLRRKAKQIKPQVSGVKEP